MKMESPLEVLSRAVSIVQSESKANSQSVTQVVNSDSGIEDDMVSEYPRLSPKNLQIKKSPTREFYIDEYSRSSPKGLHTVIKYEENSSSVEHPVKRQKSFPDYVDSGDSQQSPGKLITAVEYLRKTSPKHMENDASTSSVLRHGSTKQESDMDKSPERLNKAVKYLHASSPKGSDTNSRLSPLSKVSSPERKEYESSQRSPERLFSAVRYLQRSPQQSPKLEPEKQHSPKSYESNEYKRSSPTRVIDDNVRHVKRIKVEDPDESVTTYQTVMPSESHSSKSLSPKRCSSQPELIAKPSVSVMDTSKDNSRPVHILPRYLHSYPPYPPLFILTDKPTNYSKLMATYDSIFAPTPPLLPPYLPPAYTKCNCGDKNCTLISPSPPKYSTTPPAYKEKNHEPAEYGLPNVDEHFRKSLGEKYKLLESEHVNERPSSVDDHFAKALGQKWYSMDCSKCST